MMQSPDFIKKYKWLGWIFGIVIFIVPNTYYAIMIYKERAIPGEILHRITIFITSPIQINCIKFIILSVCSTIGFSYIFKLLFIFIINEIQRYKKRQNDKLNELIEDKIRGIMPSYKKDENIVEKPLSVQILDMYRQLDENKKYLEKIKEEGFENKSSNELSDFERSIIEFCRSQKNDEMFIYYYASRSITTIFQKSQSGILPCGVISTEKVIETLRDLQQKGYIRNLVFMRTEITFQFLICKIKIGEINFDYLPDTPLNHGWSISYEDPGPDANWSIAKDAPNSCCLLMEIDQKCAIEYDLTGTAVSLSDHLSFKANFTKTTMIMTEVRLASHDGSQSEKKWIKYVNSTTSPKPTESYEKDEWTLPVSATFIGDGWQKFNISLEDAVQRTWGNNGWQYKELLRVRLRGNLSISPIEFYKL